MSPFDEVRSLLDEGLERGFFAGAAALVSDERDAILEIYAGEARIDPRSEHFDAGTETLWDLAALTKPIAGAAILLALAESRLLGLDDPLRRFHDLYRRMKFEGVTLRRLLAHTAGQVDWYPCYVRGEGRDAYRRTLSEIDAAGPPGAAVLDSCVGYLLLADVAERVLQAPLDRFFRERIAAPLGLEKDLLFAPEGKDLPRTAGGESDDATERRRVADLHLRYMGFRDGVVNGQVNDGNAYRRGGGVSLNAGLFGTAGAVAAVGRAWLTRDSRLLSESSIHAALASATGGLGEERGLGWQLAASKGSPGEVLSSGSFGHTGLTGASLFVDPEARRVLVLLTNRLHPSARDVDMDAYRRRFHQAALRL